MADLIVEDMTGLENANSYVSIDEYKSFAELNGYDLDDDKDLAIYLVRATNFVDGFENKFLGKRLSPLQSLAFPRSIDKDNFCGEVSRLYSMQNLKKAVMFAVVAQSQGLSLLPISVSKDDFVSREKIEGAIDVQYSSEYFSNNLLIKFPMVERYLSEYFVNNSYNLSVGR